MLSGDAGLIILWFGSIGSIPNKFVICDGNNDTPDLRNEFVIGSGDIHAVNDTGGSILHSHTLTTDSHVHTLDLGAILSTGTGFRPRTDGSTIAAATDNESILSPFHSLLYIMKVD